MAWHDVSHAHVDTQTAPLLLLPSHRGTQTQRNTCSQRTGDGIQTNGSRCCERQIRHDEGPSPRGVTRTEPPFLFTSAALISFAFQQSIKGHGLNATALCRKSNNTVEWRKGKGKECNINCQVMMDSCFLQTCSPLRSQHSCVFFRLKIHLKADVLHPRSISSPKAGFFFFSSGEMISVGKLQLSAEKALHSTEAIITAPLKDHLTYVETDDNTAWDMRRIHGWWLWFCSRLLCLACSAARATSGNLSALGGLALVHDIASQCRWPRRWLIFIPLGLEKPPVWKRLFLPD